MVRENCDLCEIRQACPQNQWFVSGESPDHAAKLEQLLGVAGLHPQRRGELLVLPAGTAPDPLVAALAAGLSPDEQAAVRLAPGTPQGMLRAETLATHALRLRTAWFEDALTNDRFTFHYQPIFDLDQNRLYAHECLVRLERERLYNGGEILEAMLARGEVHRFDSYCRQKAITLAARQHQPGTKVFINFQPSSIYDPEYCLRSTLAALSRTHLQPEDVVFEVVETEQIRSVPHLRRISEFYRGQRFGFALDDVGTGSNTMDVVNELRPDYLKLDKSLTRSLSDPAVAATVRRAVELARAHGMRIIAEGIETPEMLRQARSFGIGLAQGYGLGRPSAAMLPLADGLQRIAAATACPVAPGAPEPAAVRA